MTKPFRYGTVIQFRWVRRWWFIFPYKALQFRERRDDDKVSWDPELQWTPWYDVYHEEERP